MQRPRLIDGGCVAHALRAIAQQHPFLATSAVAVKKAAAGQYAICDYVKYAI